MEKEISLPSLEPMIGRVVRVYKSGPESRVGTLLAVNDDHLVLQAEKEGVLYYFLRHIKSVSEDTKEIADVDMGGEVTEYPNADSMEDLLEELIGQTIKIDRAGPESRQGRLLAVTYDHLTMETKEEGVLYVMLQHIKSVSIVQQQNQGENGEGKKEGEGEQKEEREVHFLKEDGIDELLDALKYRWIKINRGGGEAIEGVLVDSSGDHLVLVVQQEVQRIPIYHMRNISVASKKVEEKKEEENKQENQNNGNSGSKLSSDDISYIEKMLSQKYKNRGSDRSSDRGSDRSSDRRSDRGSDWGSRRRGSHKSSDRGSDRRGSHKSSDRGSDRRGSHKSSDRGSDRRGSAKGNDRRRGSAKRNERRRGSAKGNERRRGSNRGSDRRDSGRSRSHRGSDRRGKSRSNSNSKKNSKKGGNRLTFFSR